jgi:putative copper resistance protein D
MRANSVSLLTLWRLFAGVILLLSPLMLLGITADMAGVSWISSLGFVPEVLTETHAGRVFAFYLPIALALALTAYVPVPQIFRIMVLFLFSGVLLFFQALLSHAIDNGNISIAVYFLHEVAAGLWIGALLTFWIMTRPGQAPDSSIERAARRVSKIAFWSVIGIVITGAYTAYNGLGLDVHRLLFSVYGRTLIIKVAIFAGVLAIGAYNRYWLMPKIIEPEARDMLLRNMRIESLILMLAVLGLASLLANTPPAHGMDGHPVHSMATMAALFSKPGECTRDTIARRNLWLMHR